MSQTAGIVVCSAGITGVTAAHFLNKAGFKSILLLDEHPSLQATVQTYSSELLHSRVKPDLSVAEKCFLR